MNRINDYLEPGVYEHYKGSLYVVTDVITHLDGRDGKMEPILDPLVVYRDLIPIVKHVKGKPKTTPHQTYGKKLSEFKSTVTIGERKVKRFTLT